MFSIDPRRQFRLAAAAFALSLALAGAATAQTVVVSSSGPSARSYPAGRSLGAGSKITLKAGDTLTVLDSRGTRTLRGPGSFGAEASSAAVNRGFASLVATPGRRARTGAVRRPGEQVAAPNLWFVDIASGGAFCVSDPGAVQLWRRDMQQAAELTVADSAGRSASLPYRIGENSLAWPSSLPIAEGGSYTLTGAGLPAPVRVTFRMLGAPVNDPVGAYTALDAKGCLGQKRVLAEAMKVEDTTP